MANQEYILINKDEEQGMITLSKVVFDTIMQISIDELEDVYPVEPHLRKGSVCKIVENKLVVSVDVKLKYGVNVTKACEALQQKIDSSIYQMTNLHCAQIDVQVIGFVF